MERAKIRNGFKIKSRMYISVGLSLILAIIDGSFSVWPSPILVKLNGTYDNPLGRVLTVDESSWLNSIGILGSVLGGLILMAVDQKIGRKPLITLFVIPSLVFFLAMAFFKQLWIYYLVRFAGGISIAASNALIPMYICEVAEPEVRGRLCAGMGICLNIGICLTYCTGPFLPFFWYHFCLSILPLSFLILFPLFALESPYYILQGDPIKAEQILKDLRGVEDVSVEMMEMKRNLRNSSRDGNILDLFKTKGTRRALLISVGISTFTMLSGTYVILSYIEFIFNTAGGNWPGETDSIIVGVVKLLVSISTSTISDKFGRKPLLTISFAGVGISLGTLGVYFILKDNGTDLSNFGWLPLTSLMAFVTMYNIGIGPLARAVTGELFPLQVKNTALSICAIYTAISAFIPIFLFQRIQKTIGFGQTFEVFAGISIFAAMFVSALMIETKGKTLEEIQDELNEMNKLFQ